MVIKVSLSFGRLSDAELENFTQGVIGAMTGNAAFPSPPATMVNLQAMHDDFAQKLAVAQTGGVADTAAKNNSRQALITMLRELAAYVQMKCNNDQAVLLSSGFPMQSTNRASVKLAKPEGLVLRNGASGQLVGSVNPVKNVNMYEGRAKPSDGDWLPSVFTGDSQHIIFDGLTRGKDYTVQVRALGGATGESDWSDPSTHMAM